MRSLVVISLCVTVLSAVLAVTSALHKSFLGDQSIAGAVDLIERTYIDHSQLSSEQLKALERAVREAKGGETYLTHLNRRLLHISISGFCVLALMSGFMTLLAFRFNREARNNG